MDHNRAAKNHDTNENPVFAWADNFLRPYPGLGSINMRSFGANSSSNSLQVVATRRMARGLQRRTPDCTLQLH